MAFEIGDQVGDYEVIGVLGAGRMGQVYKVRNAISDSIEAMKVLQPSLADEPTLADRFVGEIRALASLNHPNIVALHTALRVGNQFVMIMELVEGVTLQDLLKQGRIPLLEGINYICEALTALSYCHDKKVIHRDIKPSNIIRTPLGTIKLMDFGIAKTPADCDLTRPGTFIGTPYYMSPEQAKEARVDARSDLYSIGLCLYEITTGERPFHADSHFELREMQIRTPPRAPIELDPTIPSALNHIVLRALEKDPAKRFQTAEEFRVALVGVMDNPGPRLRAGWIEDLTGRRGLYLAVGAVLAIVLLVVLDIELPKIASNHRTRARTQSVKESSKSRNTLPPKSLDFPSGSMVLVEGGDALLGKDRQSVKVPSFYVDRTEVTNREYLIFCSETSYAVPKGAEQAPPDYPVVNVTFYDALKFAEWAKKRLPSATEWEKAARWTDGRIYPWGNEPCSKCANIPWSRKDEKHPKLASATAYPEGESPYHALNVLGNVWEWVDTPSEVPTENHFGEYAEEFKYLAPPLSPKDLFYQVRGGSYRRAPRDPSVLLYEHLTIPSRGSQSDIGFRCALSVHQ